MGQSKGVCTMTDNFSLISSLLDFSVIDTFYFIQILKRRKENPEMSKNSKTINVYYVFCKEDLEKIRHKIVEDCTLHNARAYINLNRLDAKLIALMTIQTIVEYMRKGQYASVQNAYTTTCGNYPSESEKKWVIDMDPEHLPFMDLVIDTLKELHIESRGRIVAIVPSKNGCHIISTAFHPEKFNRMLEEKIAPAKVPDIQKNSPTILYTL